jgi:hypothetical protein
MFYFSENKAIGKTQQPKQYSQNQQRSPMSEGGEQENQAA